MQAIQGDGGNTISAPSTGVVYKKGVVESRALRKEFDRGEANTGFFRLWKQTFSKLDLSIVTIDDDQAPPDNALNVLYDNWRGLSESSYKRKCTARRHVVLNDATHTQYPYLAVLDLNDPRRAFIGESSGRDICGGIVYFDEEGKVEERVDPFPSTLFKYNSDHVTPDWESMKFIQAEI
ncbi:MAG: hypothetical protein SGARI_003784 [Bacillariaceae sp.]